MSDPYTFWREALAGRLGDIHDGFAQCGFYRAKMDKDSPVYVPVAIWEADGRLVCKVGYQHLFQMRDANEVWLWCCRNPVSEGAYWSCCLTHEWPDEEANGFFDEAMRIIKTSDDGGELESLRNKLDARRRQENAPLLRAKYSIDAKYGQLAEKIEEAMKVLKQRKDAA